MAAAEMTVSALLGGFVLFVLYVYESLVLKPKRLRSKLEKQGIRGPPPSSILFGNIPDMNSIKLKVMREKSTATETSSTSVSKDRSLNLGRPTFVSKDRKPLFGQGIIASNGPIWLHQKKIIGPEFYFEKVKGMVDLMVDSTTTMLRSWESKIENEGGSAVFEVDKDLRSLSADIISRTSFGSNYSQGKEIFLKLRTLQKIMSQGNTGVPGARHLPTKNNRLIWRLEKEISAMILRVAKERSTEATCDKDLLQIILEGAKNYEDANSLFSGISQDSFIVDNCKSIYFAGHETTATAASWSLMLLAAHQDWQTCVRAEVLEFCRDGIPDADLLRNMKIHSHRHTSSTHSGTVPECTNDADIQYQWYWKYYLNMVIQETLRLYSPSTVVAREALEDIELKGILIPKGTNIQIPIPIVHRLPDIWGPDGHEFNPKRFEHGIAGACKFPQAYMPFGVGARICTGQHLAMTELKVILSLILSKFSFSLSPEYQHSPAYTLVIMEPEHGVSLHMRRV
ncbi:cytochrome P450 714C2-like [Malus domestica]|uniref:cytochrome P450 714C2-like n=1 Tax=Malus domestica TaxID=3750 RepID=UPI0010AA6E0C|nr:cytochrome P450 714C2-like [Malus domestica]